MEIVDPVQRGYDLFVAVSGLEGYVSGFPTDAEDSWWCCRENTDGLSTRDWTRGEYPSGHEEIALAGNTGVNDAWRNGCLPYHGAELKGERWKGVESGSHCESNGTFWRYREDEC